MRTMTVEQIAEAAGVHPLAVIALADILTGFRTGRRYSPQAVAIVGVADALAAAVAAGEVSQEMAAWVLARARR